MGKMSRESRKNIRNGILLEIIVLLVCLLTYKAQVEPGLSGTLFATMTYKHKENSEIHLDANMPELSEMIECTVPGLKRLRFEVTPKKISEDTMLILSLSEVDSGKEYYHKETKVGDLLKKGKKSKVNMKLKKAISDSEGKSYIVTWSLVEPGETDLSLTSNYKPGIVYSVNGDTSNHTNIIYNMRYGKVSELKGFYILICGLLLVFALLCYIMVYVKRLSVEKFFLPVALFLGFIMQLVVTVHGVPDEPWHLDTAYKYSNKLMLVEDTGEPGTIYKRVCDVKQEDMLANDVETNSYYQLMKHTFERPEQTELVKVSYTDSSNQAPGIVFLPTAIGISIGRLFHFSAMLTLQLGRLTNLLAFALLAWWAIKLIPTNKNLLGLISVLPITMQQAASASYDAVINGVTFLFVALVFRMEKMQRDNQLFRIRDWTALIIPALLILMVKGGLYSPLLLLVIILYRKPVKKMSPRKRAAVIIGGIFAGACAIILFLIRYLPTLKAVIITPAEKANHEELYTLSYLLKHPMKGVYMYWNTFMQASDTQLKGMLGGKLFWHEYSVNWIFLIILLMCMILFAHVTEEKYVGTTLKRRLMVLIPFVSVMLIILSMLFAVTTIEAEYVSGVQGRYFLPLLMPLLMGTAGNMVRVKRYDCYKIWVTVLMTELMIILQIIPFVL